jgi:hypothetical protein
VRGLVTKVIKHVTWYFALLLTIYKVHREKAKEKGLSKGTMTAMTVIAMESTGKEEPRSEPAQFDTDSMAVGVDNRCTACISD